jgi:hypothetical protein
MPKTATTVLATRRRKRRKRKRVALVAVAMLVQEPRRMALTVPIR